MNHISVRLAVNIIFTFNNERLIKMRLTINNGLSYFFYIYLLLCVAVGPFEKSIKPFYYQAGLFKLQAGVSWAELKMLVIHSFANCLAGPENVDT